MIRFKTTKEQLESISKMLEDIDYKQTGSLAMALLYAVLEHTRMKLQIKLIQLKHNKTTWTLTKTEGIAVLMYFNHLVQTLKPDSFEFSLICPMRDELGKQLFF